MVGLSNYRVTMVTTPTTIYSVAAVVKGERHSLDYRIRAVCLAMVAVSVGGCSHIGACDCNRRWHIVGNN